MRASATGQPPALWRRNQFHAGFASPVRANAAHTQNIHGHVVGSVHRMGASANIEPNLTRMKLLKKTRFVPYLTSHDGAQNKTPRTQSSHGTLCRSVLPRKLLSHTLRSALHGRNCPS